MTICLEQTNIASPRRIGTLAGVDVGARDAAVFAIVMAIGWTVFAWISRLTLPPFDDTLEAWSWGQHFELGYYKHPPLFAWVAGVWFRVLPHQDWATYLLAGLMIGIGLAGIWSLVRLWASPAAALSAMALVMLTPFHTVLASNFNANTILLALWPWTIYTFVRLVERPVLVNGIAFGALAALSMLSKYASILMLAGCGVALLMHPRLAAILRTPAPYVSVLVGLALIAPHIWWLLDCDFPTLAYAMEKTGYPAGRVVRKAAETGIGGLALLVPMLVAWRVALGPDTWSRLRAGLAAIASPEHRWLLPLAASAYVLTVAIGLSSTYKIATNFLIPTVFMAAVLAVLHHPLPIPAIAARRVVGIAYGYLVVALAVAPVVAIVSGMTNVKNGAEATAETARAATRIWRDTFAVPVKIVAGTEMFELAAAFYSPDNPVEFTHFKTEHAPWVTPERLKRDGLLAICRLDDGGCLADAERHAGPGTERRRLTVSRSLLGFTSGTVTVMLVMVPPAGLIGGAVD